MPSSNAAVRDRRLAMKVHQPCHWPMFPAKGKHVVSYGKEDTVGSDTGVHNGSSGNEQDNYYSV
jgi:hypothetical protein